MHSVVGKNHMADLRGKEDVSRAVELQDLVPFKILPILGFILPSR